MLSYPPVVDYMASKLVTFTPDTDIREAIDTILKRKISGTPVVDENNQLVGMLSEVDCLKLLLEGPYNDQNGVGGLGKVGDYMSIKIKTIDADKTIFDAAVEFVHNGFKRLPVVQGNTLIGQISRIDVLRAIQKMGPELQHVPDSWRGRVPVIPKHKQTHYSQNS